MKKLDQRGSHALVVVLIVVVVAVVGAVGWYVFNKQKKSTNGSVTDLVKQSATKCDSEDKDICKFFASWKDNKYYSVDTTTTAAGQTSTMKMQYVATDKYHFVTTGEGAMEIITIGNDTYTKSGDTWYKQTQKKDDTTTKLKDETTTDFKEPTTDQASTQAPTYKLIGKEACGKLTCFKYQVVDPNAKDTTEYIWFDTKDYQLRKESTQTGDTKSESTFSYDKVEINVPSPVKELGPNQVVVPGQGVVDLPSAADVTQ